MGYPSSQSSELDLAYPDFILPASDTDYTHHKGIYEFMDVPHLLF